MFKSETMAHHWSTKLLVENKLLKIKQKNDIMRNFHEWFTN